MLFSTAGQRSRRRVSPALALQRRLLPPRLLPPPQPLLPDPLFSLPFPAAPPACPAPPLRCASRTCRRAERGRRGRALREAGEREGDSWHEHREAGQPAGACRLCWKHGALLPNVHAEWGVAGRHEASQRLLAAWASRGACRQCCPHDSPIVSIRPHSLCSKALVPSLDLVGLRIVHPQHPAIELCAVGGWGARMVAAPGLSCLPYSAACSGPPRAQPHCVFAAHPGCLGYTDACRAADTGTATAQAAHKRWAAHPSCACCRWPPPRPQQTQTRRSQSRGAPQWRGPAASTPAQHEVAGEQSAAACDGAAAPRLHPACCPRPVGIRRTDRRARILACKAGLQPACEPHWAAPTSLMSPKGMKAECRAASLTVASRPPTYRCVLGLLPLPVLATSVVCRQERRHGSGGQAAVAAGGGTCGGGPRRQRQAAAGATQQSTGVLLQCLRPPRPFQCSSCADRLEGVPVRSSLLSNTFEVAAEADRRGCTAGRGSYLHVCSRALAEAA